MNSFRLTVDSNLNDIFRISAFVRDVCEGLGMNGDDTSLVEVCAVEAVTNAIKHAYGGVSGREVWVEASATPERLDLYIRDQGQTMPEQQAAKLRNGSPVLDFDPSDLDAIPEGGMGLQIMHRLMDEAAYSAADGSNCLRLTKFLKPSESPEFRASKVLSAIEVRHEQ